MTKQDNDKAGAKSSGLSPNLTNEHYGIWSAICQRSGKTSHSQLLSLLKATLESTADGIMVVDRKGVISDFNQVFTRLWRIPPDLLSSRNDSLLLEFAIGQVKDPDAFLHKIHFLYNNPNDDSFDVIEFKDGRIFERYSRPQVIGNKPVGRVWSFRDVTNKRRDENALRENEHLLSESQRIAHIGTWIMTQNGAIRWTAETYRIYGVSPETFTPTGESLVSLIHPDDRPSMVEWLRALSAEEAPEDLTFRIILPDGAVRTLHGRGELIYDASNKSTHAAGTVQDITERKQAENLLRTSEYWLRESQSVSRVGSYLMDFATGTWSSSQVMNEVFGIDSKYPRTIDGWGNILHPDCRKDMLDYFATEVVQKGNFFNREYRIIRKNDGQTRWVQGYGRLFFDKDNRPVTMAGTIQDITERKRAEDERLRLEAQILQAQKMESLGVLAGGIAHDFNNMLMVILGNADLARNETSANSPARSKVDSIINMSKNAADLCKQLLAYAGKGALIVKPINLSELIEDMMHMLEVGIFKKATLNLRLSPDLPAIEADATQIRQILMNLVMNASEAIGDSSGSITITTGCQHCNHDDVNDPHLHGTITEGPHAYFEVTDTGCGMDPETIYRIFDPFFTTKITGRGLGLKTILGIIRSHKGAIRIYSQPGKGTSFTALFPASSLPAESLSPIVHPGAGDWHGSGIIMLVDDEESVLGICRLMVEKIGFEVVTALSGQQAIELFRQQHRQIRCIVMDLTMPDMDGTQALVELQKIDPAVKLLVSSGYSEQTVAQRFSGRHIAGFIQKPYQVDTIRAVIKAALGE